MFLMDQETYGGFKVVTCKKLKKIIAQEDKMGTLIFYGDKNLVKKGKAYHHLTHIVQNDRQFNKGK
jgi:hypothetical protein